MNLEENLGIINNMISNLDIHINILSNDIELNPELDVPDKPTRSIILEQLNSKKQVLIRQKELLTNQG